MVVGVASLMRVLGDCDGGYASCLMKLMVGGCFQLGCFTCKRCNNVPQCVKKEKGVLSRTTLSTQRFKDHTNIVKSIFTA